MQTTLESDNKTAVLVNGQWLSMLKQHAQVRAKSLSGYSTDGTKITSPGKFEGEPIFAPYYWNLGLEGPA